MALRALISLAAADVVAGGPWHRWASRHSERQQLEWQELTEEGVGLAGGLLRLEAFKELPSHYHPEPYGEFYHFTRGNGRVKLGEFTANFTTFDIVPGLHVNIPARLLHGIEAGSEGCEFLWAFPARRWSEIPYLYVDPELPNRHVPLGYVAPLPLGVSNWEALRPEL